jgi:hypothetical protein
MEQRNCGKTEGRKDGRTEKREDLRTKPQVLPSLPPFRPSTAPEVYFAELPLAATCA